ncbi:MAG: hypothetical protein JW810_11485, partial [Sedimentisphaerales bacterium]|nr:hypothetical protein [Sedimentisphaerales bacterium]
MATGKRTKIVLTLAAAAMAILALATPSPGAVLKVDFNSTNQDGGPHNQADWSAYDAGHEVAADFNTKPYDGITVTPTWPNTTAA